MKRRPALAGLAAAGLVLAACSSSGQSAAATARASSTATATATQRAPHSVAAPTTSPPAAVTSPTHVGLVAPAHVVVVVEENHSYGHVLSSPDSGYFRALARQGASMTNFYAITHPSEPNYLALFSGSTHNLTDDSCPHTYSGGNLGAQLRAAHRSFTGYSEGLPRAGYRGCSSGSYARKHAPWINFSTLPSSTNQPLTAFGPDFAKLPTLSFVIPNLDHDMHDGTVGQADAWLRRHLDPYVRWARTHHSVLVVTWDEDDHSDRNRIPTIIVGSGVRAGRYAEHADLYRLLRTLQWRFGLPPLGASAHRTPITDVWTR